MIIAKAIALFLALVSAPVVLKAMFYREGEVSFWPLLIGAIGATGFIVLQFLW